MLGAQEGGKGKRGGRGGFKVKGASSASSNNTTDIHPPAAGTGRMSVVLWLDAVAGRMSVVLLLDAEEFPYCV